MLPRARPERLPWFRCVAAFRPTTATVTHPIATRSRPSRGWVPLSWYVQRHDTLPSGTIVDARNHRGRHETSPPKFSPSGRRRCRASGSIGYRSSTIVSDAAGAHHDRLCTPDGAMAVGTAWPTIRHRRCEALFAQERFRVFLQAVKMPNAQDDQTSLEWRPYIFARDQWHCRICGDRFQYSETVRKHVAHAHHENMPPSMYEYFRGAVWHRKKIP